MSDEHEEQRDRQLSSCSTSRASHSASCPIAPSAAHRLRFHTGERAWIVEYANRMMISGLAFLALALGGSVLLITDLMFDGARVWIHTSVGRGTGMSCQRYQAILA